MTATLLIEIALKSALISGAALLLLRLLKGRSAAERSWIAGLGLLATLFLPLATLAPRWRIAPPPALDAITAPLVARTAVATASLPVEASATTTAAIVPHIALPHVSVDVLLILVYGLPAIALLAATLLALLRLVALRQRAAVLVEPSWLSALAHAQRRMGFKSGAALLVSDELRSPISWGLVRPTIVINPAALESEAGAEAIIAHELAHVVRLDWLNLLVARAATAVFWFNPLVWTLARQHHQLCEEAADDAVIEAAVSPADYAALLVGAARHESRGMLLAANGVAPSRGSLKQRIVRVLDGAVRRGPARLGWALASGLVALAVAGPLSALTTIAAPVAPAPPSPLDAALATRPDAAPAIPAPPSRPRVALAPRPGPAAPGVPVALAAAAKPAPALAPAAAANPRPMAPAAAPLAPLAPAAARPRLTPDELIALATQGVSMADVDEISAISPRYARFTGAQLAGMAVQGVDADWLREMKALGYGDLEFKEIIGMAVQGIDPGYVRKIKAAGYGDATARQLIDMAIQGVDPSFAAGWARNGHPSPDLLVRYKIHGLDPPDKSKPPRD